MFLKPVLIAFFFGCFCQGLHPEERWIGVGSDPFLPFEPYIIGGVPVEGREFPAQISLQFNGQHNCGGSILNSEWIVTAAHCSLLKPSEMKIVTGSNYIDQGGTEHQILEVVTHEDLDPSQPWLNDIALMKVSPPIVFEDGVAPVKLPKWGQETPSGSNATVVGWGITSESGTAVPNELMKVDVKIVDHKNCTDTYAGASMNVYDTEICAGGEGSKDACNGDSGGPLYVNGEIVGIVSWGVPCAVNGFPTVYTKVSDYIDWIESRTYDGHGY